MRSLGILLAGIGGFTLFVLAVVGVLAVWARLVESRRRARWRDEHLLNFAREHGPEAVAANPSTFQAFADVHGLRAPKGWRS